MKAEFICLLVLLTAVVEGKMSKKSELKRDKLLNVLLQRRIQGLGQQTQQAFGDFDDGSYDLDGGSSEQASSIDAIQQLLYTLAMYLEPLKEEVKNGNEGEAEGLMNSIESLAFEIQMLESELYSFPEKEIQTATTDLLYGLHSHFGLDFLQAVWEIYDNLPRYETPMMQENYEGTGYNVTQSSSAERLSQLTYEVRRISAMVSGIVNGNFETTLLLRAITDALYNISSETSSTNGTPEHTTSTPEVPTESSTTAGGSQTTEGESETTEGGSETTESGIGSETTEGGSETTTAETLVQKKQQMLQRRLIDLLLKKKKYTRLTYGCQNRINFSPEQNSRTMSFKKRLFRNIVAERFEEKGGLN